MKVAIFHNYMDNIGGAERVVLTLARELNADVYSTVASNEAIRKLGFDIRVNEIGWIPRNAPFRQQWALTRFRRLALNGKYDCYIVAGDWALSGVMKNKPNIWYAHSPVRELWDLYSYIKNHKVPRYARWIFDLWVKFNRLLYKKYIFHAGLILCNSSITQKRIKRYLGKNAEVVYPPIETSLYHYQTTGDYWLSVNRLFDHKRVDLQMEIFRKIPNEKLIIVGSYERGSKHFEKYMQYVKRIKPANVEILHWVDFEKLVSLYANCKAFITTSMDEDFGMAAVEAMASGKPVVAVDEGGYRETIIHNKTGKLVSADIFSLVNAVREISKNASSYRNACLERAKFFDVSIFINKIRESLLCAVTSI